MIGAPSVAKQGSFVSLQRAPIL